MNETTKALEMNGTTKSLDLRGMPLFERHAKIFQLWESLKPGETMRITNDHEPKPLYYMFEAEHKGQFKWEYEGQGPEDWIFRIKKISQEKNKKEQIKALLKQLHSRGDSEEMKKKAKLLFNGISPADLALLEQEIIEEGTTRQEMRKLCDVHLEVMKDRLGNAEIDVEPGHPLHTLMEEHKAILDFVEKLKHTAKLLESAKGFSSAADELEMLEHIAEHLVEADKHHQREEEVLFPALEKRGVTEPPEIMKEEHEELKARKKILYKLAREGITAQKGKSENMKYADFAKKLKENADYLIKELPNHIYKENNILYPLAIQTIPKDEWNSIKKKCDKIGYCCFTPAC